VNFLILLFLFKMPFYVVQPSINVIGTTVVVSFHKSHKMAMPNIYYFDENDLLQPGMEIYDPKYLENIWYPDTVDTIFRFQLNDIKIGHVYHFQLEWTDLVKGKELSSKGYKFRIIKRGDSLRLGGIIDLGPALGDLTENGITVFWRTNFPSYGAVFLKGKGIFKDSTLSRWHRIHLTGLEPRKSYTYHVISTFPEIGDTFTSRPYRFVLPDPYNFKFAVFGDTRANWKSPGTTRRINGVNVDILRRLAVQSLKDNASFIVILGDLIRGYTEDTNFVKIMYETWWWALEPVSPFIPIFTVVGNHDATAPIIKTGKHSYIDPPPPYSVEDFWQRYFTNPQNGPENPEDPYTYKGNVYYFKIGPSIFLILNPDHNYHRKDGKLYGMHIDSIQYRWADSILNTIRVPYKFLMWHEPLIATGGHRGSCLDLYPDARDSVAALLLNHGITTIFNAHEHIYARVWIDPHMDFIRKSKIIKKLASKSDFTGFYEIITGGGGAPASKKPEHLPDYVKKYSTENHYVLGNVTPHGVKFTVKNIFGWPIDSFGKIWYNSK